MGSASWCHGRGVLSRPDAPSAPVPSEVGHWLGFYTQLATAVSSGSQASAPVQPTHAREVLGLMEAARRSFVTKARVVLCAPLP